VRIKTAAEKTVFTAPATITVVADAADPDGMVTQVEFYNDTALWGVDTTAPYTITWQATTAATYTITAKVFDDNLASTVSSPLTITVGGPPTPPPDETPPEEDLPPPSITASVGTQGVITITVEITTNIKIDRVEFYHKQTRLGSDSVPPYRFIWTNVSAGAYVLSAKVYASNGTSIMSEPYTVVIKRDDEPPTGPGEDPGSPMSNPVYLPIIVALDG
jgi:hypothetical protein